MTSRAPRPFLRWSKSALLAALCLWLTCLVPASAGDMDHVDATADTIPDAAFDKRLVVIGEAHPKPRSHALTLRLIKRTLRHPPHVAFALEMPASGSDEWRQAVDPSALDQIGIGSIHDSPSRRNLRLATSEMARHECLSLQAIDDPKDGSVEVTDRGAYMADRLLALTDSAEFVVVLVGNLHPLRHLDWNFDHDEKPVSRYLADAGLPLYVVLQDWKQQDERTECSRPNRLQAWMRSTNYSASRA